LISKTPSQTIEEAITSAYNNNYCLVIGKDEMAFVVGIYVYLQHITETTITEATLIDIYSRVNSLIFGDDATIERRARNSIIRLREQGVLIRVAGQDTNPYVLSTLGAALGQNWESNYKFSTQSLVIYTSQLRIHLDRVRESAKAANGDSSAWNEYVILQLSEIVRELISCIRQRQDGMTKSQESIKKEISEKISAEWVEAIDSCENILRQTGEAISELHKLIMQETDSLIAIIQDIGELAATAGNHEAVHVAESVQNQLDTTRNWAHSAHEDWSRFYGNVHSYIRTFVRCDPKRELSYRMRTAIFEFGKTINWSFNVPEELKCYQISDVPFNLQAPRMQLSSKTIARPTEQDQPPDMTLYNHAAKRVQEELEGNGICSLAPIVSEFANEGIETESLYLVAGDLVEIMAKAGAPSKGVSTSERRYTNYPWVTVALGARVQNFVVVKGAPGRERAKDE